MPNQDNAIVAAAKAASEKWKAAFNAGDAEACAACYEQTAVVVAKPFGSFHGRSEIEALWRQVIGDGFSDVEYLEPEFTAQNDTTALLTSRWKMNKAHGVITKELWVLQDDGSVLLREDEFEALG
ncbi:nuclear transport factor 2 family protein [Pelagibius sp. Alg239-R121]|uniref:YybH family protein n=1 Tax=Pelagibius sp. Alg239-R121 TaxID=2993448 RepID=UPI0024A72276|nr:nuclear transport factor 2 family protein [Pelagibius sp. Alg239-R121]